MFISIFFSVLRSFIIPLGVFLLFRNLTIAGNPIGENYVFLGVTVALTLANIFSILFQVIKLLPNALLLRGHAILKLLLRIIIEVSSIIGFWLYYFTNYAK